MRAAPALMWGDRPFNHLCRLRLDRVGPQALPDAGPPTGFEAACCSAGPRALPEPAPAISGLVRMSLSEPRWSCAGCPTATVAPTLRGFDCSGFTQYVVCASGDRVATRNAGPVPGRACPFGRGSRGQAICSSSRPRHRERRTWESPSAATRSCTRQVPAAWCASRTSALPYWSRRLVGIGGSTPN